ncbi:MAG: PLP-dependent aminotransferase family protein [Lachnospiraceae bacterium]|nr:PLP-dependent aminotransferase family protein [Lachnospiraceae bacterium]
MLSYDLSRGKGPLYQKLYQHIKQDILQGKLSSGEKLPSKRMLAKHMGVSTITVENAYDQLMGEGYVYALPKKGYYVANLSDVGKIRPPAPADLHIQVPEKREEWRFDFSSNRTEPENFPFSIWAKLMRETISVKERELLQVPFCGGVLELRQAIAGHLSSFRGMAVDPNQIIVGAGTEYLYGLLIQLLGRDKVYCVENPGYDKVPKIYESNGATCVYAAMDREGIVVDDLRCQMAQVAHVSPTHHFPTGITMPASRRYELLAWANEVEERYIIEDDYDSEFRLKGKPIPPLFAIDACEKVIYMNTFSKSLTSTIRISYMVLPEHLAKAFYQKLSFYACTVPTFEQYTLAAFIRRGYFEKHINRMRLHYGRMRTRIMEIIDRTFLPGECRVMENDSGLHFVLELATKMSDREMEEHLREQGIKMKALTDFQMTGEAKNGHQFILNYSNMDVEGLEEALLCIRKLLEQET